MFYFNTRFLTFIFTIFLFCGCMTSQRQDQLQTSIQNLQDEIVKINSQLNSKDQLINSSTQTALSSQNETQNLKDQLQLTQGAVDELKNKIKKIEENAGSTTPDVVNIDSNTQSHETLQKRISHLELISHVISNEPRKGKMPAKIKNISALTNQLKTLYEKGSFDQVIDLSTRILNAHDATEEMLATALEYRGDSKFQLQQYRGAAIDLVNVIQFHSKAPKISRDLLLVGDSYVYLNSNSTALLYYQDCVKNYPNSPEAKAAVLRINQMKTPSLKVK